MKKTYTVLVAAVALAIFMIPGIALADKGGGTQDPPPDNPPCDADHGHPLENLLRLGKECPPANTGSQTGNQTGGQTGNQTTGQQTTGQQTTGQQTTGVTTTDGADPCTAAAGDPGLLTDDTLAQTLWDSGLSALSPLLEDPDADGPLSGAIRDAGEGQQFEVLTDELGCLVDLPIDPATFGFDL